MSYVKMVDGTQIQMSAEEIAERQAEEAAWASGAGERYDAKARACVDSIDRLYFEVAFNIENRVRAVEGAPALTRGQYRDALVGRWKQLNP